MTNERKKPIRMCVNCRGQSDKQELIRIVRSKDAEVRLDLTGKANGRGAYLCKDAGCLEKARRKRSLERALKHEIPDNVYNELEAEMKKA